MLHPYRQVMWKPLAVACRPITPTIAAVKDAGVSYNAFHEDVEFAYKAVRGGAWMGWGGARSGWGQSDSAALWAGRLVRVDGE